MRKTRAKVSFANVASTVALVLSLSTGVAYAAGTVFSSDIVNGQVKTVDLADGAVTSPKVRDNSLTGADVNESTLRGVNAASVDGYSAAGIVRIGNNWTTSNVAMPDCNPGIDYLVESFTAPRDGWALVNASFTAGHPDTATVDPIFARVEQTAPGFVVGIWQEGTLKAGPGGDNIAVTDVFQVAKGTNTFVLKVCDSSDFVGVGSGETREGQITVVFTPFKLS